MRPRVSPDSSALLPLSSASGAGGVSEAENSAPPPPASEAETPAGPLFSSGRGTCSREAGAEEEPRPRGSSDREPSAEEEAAAAPPPSNLKKDGQDNANNDNNDDVPSSLKTFEEGRWKAIFGDSNPPVLRQRPLDPAQVIFHFKVLTVGGVDVLEAPEVGSEKLGLRKQNEVLRCVDFRRSHDALRKWAKLAPENQDETEVGWVLLEEEKEEEEEVLNEREEGEEEKKEKEKEEEEEKEKEQEQEQEKVSKEKEKEEEEEEEKCCPEPSEAVAPASSNRKVYLEEVRDPAETERLLLRDLMKRLWRLHDHLRGRLLDDGDRARQYLDTGRVPPGKRESLPAGTRAWNSLRSFIPTVRMVLMQFNSRVIQPLVQGVSGVRIP